MNKSESIKELAAALAKAQGELDKAKKSSKNPHFRSNYANLEEVWDACREHLSANGLSVIQSVGQSEDHKPNLTTMLLHNSGEFLENTVTLPTVKPGPQEVGSCLTYMKRYCLAAMVGVADSDDDAEAAEGRKEQYIRTPSYSGTPVQPKAVTPSVSEAAPSTTAAEVYRPPAGNYKSNPLSDKQLARMYAIGKKQNWSVQLIQAHIKEKFNKAPSDMSRKEYEDVCDYFGTVECGSGYQPGKSVVAQMEKVKKTGYVDHTTNFVPGPDTTDDIPF